MKYRIYITKQVASEVKDFLKDYCDYEIWEYPEMIPRQELLSRVKEVDGILAHGCKIDEELLEQAPKLKVVSNMSVGYNNLDISALKKRGIIGTNTPGVLNESVADLVIALILVAARRITELDKYVKEGRWDKLVGEDLFGTDVHHSTLGIIGMGSVGETVACRAKYGFGMKICYHNRRPRPEAEMALEAEYMSLDELLKASDFVVLLTPLTPETNNLIGMKELKQMKKTAFLINASRGETVIDADLIKALEDGIIRGAAIDVYRKEPIEQNDPLLKAPNLVTLPHIGSAVKKTRDEMAMLGAKNLLAALKGEQPPNVIKELIP